MVNKDYVREIAMNHEIESKDFEERINEYMKTLEEVDGKLVDYKPQRIREDFISTITSMFLNYRYYSQDPLAKMDVTPHIVNGEVVGYIVDLATESSCIQLVMSDSQTNEITMVEYKVDQNGKKRLWDYQRKSDSYHKYDVAQLDMLEQLKSLMFTVSYFYLIPVITEEKTAEQIAEENTPEYQEDLKHGFEEMEAFANGDEPAIQAEDIHDAAEQIRREFERKHRKNEKQQDQKDDDDSNHDD